MRILHIAPGYYPSIGGAESHIRGLSEGLVKKGHDVTVFTTWGRALKCVEQNEALSAREILNGVKVQRFKEYYGFGRFLKSIWVLPLGYRFTRYILGADRLKMLCEGALNPKLVLETLRFQAEVTTIVDWYDSLAAEICASRRIKRFQLVALPLFHTEEAWSRSSLFGSMLKRCTRVFVNTSHEKSFVNSLTDGSKEISVVGVGIEPSLFSSRNGKAVRADYGIGPFPVVGYVGRIEVNKGVIDLIRSMLLVWDEIPEVRLVLAGYRAVGTGLDKEIGGLIDSLSTSDRSRIILISNFEETEKASIFDAFDVFAMPSVGESFGIAYLEAWMCQKPVVGSRIGSTQCVIEDGSDGLLVNVGDVRGLADAILTLLRNGELRYRMGKRGYQKTLSQYTWDAVTDKVERIYYSIAGDSHEQELNRKHVDGHFEPLCEHANSKETVAIPGLVSVCIPTYNGSPFLRECLDSVLNQTFQNIEVVVVDDVSTDDSVSIVEEYVRSDKRVRLFVNKKNLGLVQNWNRCVDLAKGEWVKFVFQDDIIMPSCISRMLEVSRPDVDLVAVRRNLMFAPDTSDTVRETYISYVSEHDLALHFPDCSYVSPENLSRFLLRVPDRNCIGEPTATMVRKRVFPKFGYFNPNLVSLCDWEYFARVGVNTGLCYINEPLASFRVHGGARSSELRKHWGYAADAIDSLIIHHEMAYSEAYSALRNVAANQNPPISLRHKLAEAVRSARWEAIATQDNGQAKAELWRTLKSYPKILMFPLDYLTKLGLQKLRHLKAPEPSKRNKQ